jgi:hypothetical protein
MVSRMRNLENAARLAMAHVDMPAVSLRPALPATPAAEGLLRRILSMIGRLLTGR